MSHWSELNLDLAKSPGYPWKLKYRTKQDAVDKDPMATNLRKRAEQIGWHKEPELIWDAFPKIEVLPAEKAARKSRLIVGAPVDLYLLHSEFCRDFDNKLHANYFQFGSAVGMNIYEGGWSDSLHQITDNLTRKLDEADCKEWDKRFWQYWMYLTYEIRWNLIDSSHKTEENFHAYWYCVSEVLTGLVHMSSGEILRIVGGMFSGDPTTCPTNTLGHLLLVVYSMLKSGMDRASIVDELYHMGLYGDDNIGRAKDDKFWENYRTFGVNLPDENLKRGLDITQASFLSMGYQKTRLGWMPRTNWKKGYKMLFTSNNKKMIALRAERLQGLYLVHYWSPLREIIEGLSVELGVKLPGRYSIESLWSYRLADGGINNNATEQ